MPTRSSSCRVGPTATDASTPSWSAGARHALSNSSDTKHRPRPGRGPQPEWLPLGDTRGFDCLRKRSPSRLRPTTDGGHYVVEEVIRAQFGDLLRRFGMLRRRRNELEYLTLAGDRADADEAAVALDDARTIIQAVERLLPDLALF